MTEEQEARFARLVEDSLSDRGERDPERYIFLRGWNEGLKHALLLLAKAKTEPPQPQEPK